MHTRQALYAMLVIASCAREGAAKDAAPMTTDDKPAIHKAPPTPNRPPAADTARYTAWLEQRGTPVTDKPREDTSLRLGDWGFFDHGSAPGVFLDRAALDKAGHAVTGEKGEWRALLTTPGLDAAAAHKRIAWLLRAQAIDPTTTQKVNQPDKLTAPSLTVAKDGTATFVGWLVYPPNIKNPMRVTITATATGATFAHDAASKL